MIMISMTPWRNVSAILFSFLVVATTTMTTVVVVQACPATLASDGILYITNCDSLYDCQFEYSGTLPSEDTSVGIVGTFDCEGSCQGKILNSNYIFWNAPNDDWEEMPPCQPDNDFSSCEQLSDLNCQDLECESGIFKCHTSYAYEEMYSAFCGGTVTSSSPLPECPGTVSGPDEFDTFFAAEGNVTVSITGETQTDYTVTTDFRTCVGSIDYLFDPDTYCPPAVVSSYEEVEHYCIHGDIMASNNDFYCDFYDKSQVCQGRIDSSIEVPECHIPNITSCADDDYYSVCEYAYDCDPDSPSGFYKNCRGSFFACWDNVDQQWCQGSVVATYGNFSNPVCPSSVTSCGELERYGIDHDECDCFDFGGCGGFSCGDWDDTYCEGDIQPDDTNVTLTTIVFIEPNDDDQPPFPHKNYDDDNDDYFDDDDRATGNNLNDNATMGFDEPVVLWATLLATSILIGGGVVTVAISRRRRRHLWARKIALHGAEVELALEMTVNHLDEIEAENNDDNNDDDSDGNGDEYSALPMITVEDGVTV